MKKILLSILKRYRVATFITVFFIGLNIFVSTFPSKIIGMIIDLLYDIPTNKITIIKYSFYLIGVVILSIIFKIKSRKIKY